MVIVVDTSAWIDFFRDSRTPAAVRLQELIEAGADLAITEPILMEVLAGARSAEALARLRAELLARPLLRLEGLADFETAAEIYRVCRVAGDTPRNQLDCLIAVPAIRHGASLLHNDRDFDVIARHTVLKTEPTGGRRAPDGGRGLRERRGRWRRGAQRRRGKAKAPAR